MLREFAAILSQLCHMAGLLLVLYGALLLIGAVLGQNGPMGMIRGGVLILLGSWFAGLAG